MSEIVFKGFQKVASGIYLEGLAVDHKTQDVWYSDVIAGGIHCLSGKSQYKPLNPDRMWTGGVLMNADGCVLSSGPRGIMWNNPTTGASGWLIAELDGKPVNGINEMVPDGEGGIFFGTSDIEMVVRGEPARPTDIYRLTQDRSLFKLAEGIGFTNGLMFDAARKRFYCNDTFNCTWVFDVQADLTLANKRQLIVKEDVDGMALDAEGNIWITGFRSSHIVRVAPDGTELHSVQTPAGAITQLRFGGADGCDVYINSVPSDGGDSLKDGEIPTANNSFLYHARSPVPGQLLAPANFNLS